MPNTLNSSLLKRSVEERMADMDKPLIASLICNIGEPVQQTRYKKFIAKIKKPFVELSEFIRYVKNYKYRDEYYD